MIEACILNSTPQHKKFAAPAAVKKGIRPKGFGPVVVHQHLHSAIKLTKIFENQVRWSRHSSLQACAKPLL